MLRDHVEAPIQDHHHHKLLPPLLHSAEISENKAKTRKKEEHFIPHPKAVKLKGRLFKDGPCPLKGFLYGFSFQL
jgi:hypothetical protein